MPAMPEVTTWLLARSVCILKRRKDLVRNATVVISPGFVDVSCNHTFDRRTSVVVPAQERKGRYSAAPPRQNISSSSASSNSTSFAISLTLPPDLPSTKKKICITQICLAKPTRSLPQFLPRDAIPSSPVCLSKAPPSTTYVVTAMRRSR